MPNRAARRAAARAGAQAVTQTLDTFFEQNQSLLGDMRAALAAHNNGTPAIRTEGMTLNGVRVADNGTLTQQIVGVPEDLFADFHETLMEKIYPAFCIQSIGHLNFFKDQAAAAIEDKRSNFSPNPALSYQDNLLATLHMLCVNSIGFIQRADVYDYSYWAKQISNIIELLPEYLEYTWFAAGLRGDDLDRFDWPYIPRNDYYYGTKFIRIANNVRYSTINLEIIRADYAVVKEKYATRIAVLYQDMANAYCNSDLEALNEVIDEIIIKLDDVNQDSNEFLGTDDDGNVIVPPPSDTSKILSVLLGLALDLKMVLQLNLVRPIINLHMVFSVLCGIAPNIGASSWKLAGVYPKEAMGEFVRKGEPFMPFPTSIEHLTEFDFDEYPDDGTDM